MSKSKNKSIERVNSKVLDIESYSVPGIECPVRLDGNESPFATNPQMLEEIYKKLSSIELNRYPDPDCKRLKDIVSNMIGFNKDGILFGNGSDELIQMLVETFTGKSGVVLVPRPTFSMYRLTSLILNNIVVETGLDSNFELNLEDIRSKIEEFDPDLLFFASPNNPTGNAFSADKIIKIVESTTGIVVVDEAYFDYYGYTFIPEIEKYDNFIVLRTLSKIGFASIRLGILFGNPALVNEINKTRLPYNINSISQQVAEVAFNNSELLEENFKTIIAERERLFEELNKIENIKVFPSDSNFFLIKVPDSEIYFNDLVERGILVRNLGSSPGLEGCIRVTIGTPRENEAFLGAISAISSS